MARNNADLAHEIEEINKENTIRNLRKRLKKEIL